MSRYDDIDPQDIDPDTGRPYSEIARREHAAEMGESSPSELRWFQYCRDIEEMLRIDDLDGDEEANGYSLDSAHDAFRVGTTAKQYADAVLDNTARELTSSTVEHDDDGYGGSRTLYAVCSVPFIWNDERVGQWVRDRYPPVRCEHEYDCCGNYYATFAGEWALADVDAKRRKLEGEEGEKKPVLILVRQGWTQNV